MIIEISGQGNMGFRLARALIEDFIKGDECTHFYLPPGEIRRSAGLHNVEEAIRDLASTHPIKIFEVEDDDQADILFVIDVDFDADKIDEYLKAGKKVYDLSLALYPIT